MIRCIWPEEISWENALTYILQTNSLFNKNHVTRAQQLLDAQLLGFDKLSILFDLICKEKKTPRKWTCSVADGLGPFSILLSLKRQICDKLLHTTPADEPVEITDAPKKRPRESISRASLGQLQASPTPLPKRLRSGDANMDENYQPAPSHRESRGVLEADAEHANEVQQAISGAIPNEVPEPRTPTETLVVDFMVNLLGGISFLLQPLAWSTACVANSYETTYKFGPICSNATDQKNLQFQARIDGSIPFGLPPSKRLPELVMFEVKRAERDHTQWTTVRGQQSMEHVAYIWKRHEKDQPVISFSLSIPHFFFIFILLFDLLLLFTWVIFKANFIIC